jgi:hypothetical protein
MLFLCRQSLIPGLLSRSPIGLHSVKLLLELRALVSRLGSFVLHTLQASISSL